MGETDHKDINSGGGPVIGNDVNVEGTFVGGSQININIHSSPLAQTTVEGDEELFALPIRNYMAEIHRDIDRLTKDQYRVIQQLRFMKRVRISGCAGSGKTLVAAEKACQLASNGLNKVLFLCHNPLLSEYVHNLTAGSNVYVANFCQWVAHLADSPHSQHSTGWNHYEEPDEHALVTAFEKLTSGENPYDAIIVDEGQDFRSEWWIVVEAALRSTRDSSFYIFHDDNQTLLTERGLYPFEEPQVDLSRNCRNSGRVYELIR